MTQVPDWTPSPQCCHPLIDSLTVLYCLCETSYAMKELVLTLYHQPKNNSAILTLCLKNSPGWLLNT